MKPMLGLCILSVTTTTAILTAHATGQVLGPLPYLQASDSPFNRSGLGTTFFLEDFEDLDLNVPGVTVVPAGFVCGCGSLTDSVDGDDGMINGLGVGGHSYFSGDGNTGFTFTFSPAPFGMLPTRAGIVWTDGAGTVTFQAFDAAGDLIGSVTGTHPDGLSSGTTDEDRFYGVIHAGGIQRIRISNSGGGIEVDHLQYGVETCRADFNGDGVRDPDDLSDFITCFFLDVQTPGVCGRADFNADGFRDPDDLSDFITAFFLGC